MAKKAEKVTVLTVADLDAVTDTVESQDVDDDTPRVMTLTEAIEDGDYLEILLAQRRAMAADVVTVGGPAKAAMYRQMALLSKEIAGLELEKKQLEQEDGDAGDDDDEDEPVDPASF